MMKTYIVRIPEYWYSFETIEASNEKEAIRRVYDGEGDQDANRPPEYVDAMEPEDSEWKAWEKD